MKNILSLVIFSGASLAFALGLFTFAWSKDLTSEDLTFFPKPNPLTSTPRNYELDEDATINYYDNIFEGKSATEIVRFLEGNGYYVFFYTKDELSFMVAERIMVVYSYEVTISLKFSDGVFQKSFIVGYGII